MIGKNTVLRAWMGIDHREQSAWRAARDSFYKHATMPAGLSSMDMHYLRECRYYTRGFEEREGRYFDPISQSPMSTAHALTRFLLPWMACHVGWAIFTDSDIIWRADPRELFLEANQPENEGKALLCVQHRQPETGPDKMDGQRQTAYARKNWSSVMLWNCAHPAHKRLTLDDVNTRPGLWLHQFAWLEDAEIGALPPAWNHLVGVDKHDPEAKLAHFTLGTPDMRGYEAQPFADEWRSYLNP